MKALTKQRLLKVADAIEAAPADRFDMKNWLSVHGDQNGEESPGLARRLNTACGTSGCIAGWAVATFPQAGNPHADRYYNIADHAERILGLTDREARALFNSGMQMNDRKAVQRIRQAVEDDEIRPVGPRGGRIG